MAGKKETPRQKMIGMMYLVLTALLALNVQREILDAFVVLNDGIEQTNNDNQMKVESLYSDLKFSYNLDNQKVDAYWNSATSLKRKTQDLTRWIDSLKTTLIAQTEGITREVADTISLDQIDGLEKHDESTRILIGPKEDASQGQAHEMKTKILNYHQWTGELLQKLDLKPVNLSINFSSKKGKKNVQNWELKTFYDTPLAASVAILNKLKADVKNIEYEVLNKIAGEIDSDDIPVDTIVARIIPSNRYVVVGEEYHSDIFLGAYSTTLTPEMEVNSTTNESQNLEVVDGVGSYSFRPTHPGNYKYSGNIILIDKKGIKKKYPFESEFVAVQPRAVVSATAMNVFYKGLENPVSISVPGIEDENIVATISGSGNRLEKISSGKYKVMLANNSPTMVTIKVAAKLMDGTTKNMGIMEFRSKFLPKPYVKLGKIISSGNMKASELANNRGLIAKYDESFIFGLPIKVNKFSVVIIKNGSNPTYTNVTGNRFSDKLRNQFKSLHSGDQVIFEDVWAKGKDGKSNLLNNIIVKITN